MINKLSFKFSEPLKDVDQVYNRHPFPPPSKLSQNGVEDDLRQLGFGYRAKYVHHVALTLLDEHKTDQGVFDYLCQLRKDPYDVVIPQLTRLMGVGPKVADCVALMSLDQFDSIPVDTHVWQIAIRDYNFLESSYVKLCKGRKVTQSTPMNPSIYAAVGKMFRDLWGPYAGWAHTVLFAADLKAFKDQSPSTKDKESTAEINNIKVEDSKEKVDVVPGVVTTIISPDKQIKVPSKLERVVTISTTSATTATITTASDKKIDTLE
ncbi:N-glycosylase/DNA lyase [Wallemia ichthyophaga EXF-994]|uniref:DNA-(apurinic or apyrimidinic site) lyase n=1 Tax=Wallemia ichthyophaga (strain EXF-994 / CBS 113033) TaxID=1299270 RepID=R9ABF4_WALI9|nr:N-glycosylase/DNA lyase [Wallemia ichthyophaga EXF-994]EOQ99457.1 N-glycosylase/DNA lyase [Wallemia ichthyophaga EXF-994]